MILTSKTLLSLTAADLMSPTVVTVPQDMSLRAAAHLLAQSDVSGAPVIDSDGRCIGVISARDFVTWAERGPEATGDARSDKECYCSDWRVVPSESLPAELVRSYMTGDPVIAAPGTSIGTVARMMIDARIHRLIVVDGQRRPIGVVSSTDVLAAVAQAAQRQSLDGGRMPHAGEASHVPIHSGTP
jgi:CBS-domain-containing membrane protein